MSAKGRFNRKAVEAATLAALQASIVETSIAFQREAKLQLSKAGTGRKHSGLRYQSSAPGQPPAVQTGHLRRSVQFGGAQFVEDRTQLGDRKRPRIRVGTNVKYAAWLEFGTRHIAPRPYMRPARERTQKVVSRIVRSNLRRHLGKVRP